VCNCQKVRVWRNAINKQTKIFSFAKKCKDNFGFGASQQQQQQQQQNNNKSQSTLEIEIQMSKALTRWKLASNKYSYKTYLVLHFVKNELKNLEISLKKFVSFDFESFKTLTLIYKE